MISCLILVEVRGVESRQPVSLPTRKVVKSIRLCGFSVSISRFIPLLMFPLVAFGE